MFSELLSFQKTLYLWTPIVDCDAVIAVGFYVGCAEQYVIFRDYIEVRQELQHFLHVSPDITSQAFDPIRSIVG